MNWLTIVVLIFLALGGIDYLLGNKFGLGKEFEKGFMLLGTMALSMLGMLIISPLLAEFLSPVTNGAYTLLGIDPSIIPASLFSNDMGGATLSAAVAKDAAMGNFNGLVVSSMMGSTLSYAIPVAIQLVNKKHHRQLAFGLLCGIVTIPVGCFVAGLICRLPFWALLFNLLPLILLSAIIAAGLIFAPEVCVKIFKGLGVVIKGLIVAGLLCGALNFLSGKTIIEGVAPLDESTIVCMNASLVLAGMFPLISTLSRLLNTPLTKLGNKLGMKSVSVTGLIASLASATPMFGCMDKMDDKGILLNSAFAVSGGFVFGGHLAFTMAYNADYLLPVIVGKLIGGVCAVALGILLYKKLPKNKESTPVETPIE